MEEKIKQIVQEVAEKYNGKVEDKGKWIYCEVPDLSFKTPVYLIIHDSAEQINYSIPIYLQFSVYAKSYLDSARKTAETIAKEIEELKLLGTENSIIIKANEEIIKRMGYRLLKEKGKEKIYQKAIGKKYSGFFQVTFSRGKSKLSLTPGDYEDPGKLLEREKSRIEKA
jgi:hypothetical protein